MELLNDVRYAAALAALIAMPQIFVFWFVIHPFAGFWRRAGAPSAYAAALGSMILAAALVFGFRQTLLGRDWGFQWPLAAAGAAILALGVRLGRRRHADLGFTLLAGLPELDPERHPAELKTDGVYAQMRHPRYAEFQLMALGTALIVNYPALYAAWAASSLLMVPLAALEERELRQRFGEAYERYAERVPRFVPASWLKRSRDRE